MKITIFGTGYVGLTTALGFAELGHKVIGFDIDPQKVEVLKRREAPIYEPGVQELLNKHLSAGNVDFTDNVKQAVDFATVIFIATGTPSREDGEADLSQVESAVRMIAENMEEYKLIVEKSTVPVGTHKWIKRIIRRYQKREIEFDVASNPEFLSEGSAIEDFLYPDRVVIGVENERSKQLLLEIYKPLKAPIVITSIPSAEIIKYASNIFMAMKISFINMIANLCEKTGADVKEVAEGIGYDRRIGKLFLGAGIGFGGSCFPKDIKAFYKTGEKYGLNFELVKAVEDINKERIDVFISHVKKALWNIKNKQIGIWGLSFKPNTDDIREAPSLKVIERLLNEGAYLTLYDPKAMENVKRVYPPSQRVRYAEDKYKAIEGKEALLIITEWDEFKKADLEKVKSLLKLPIIIDGRNIYEPDVMEKLGFEYYPMGRRHVWQEKRS